MSGIAATLAERGSRYGPFDEHARIAQAIKSAMADSPNWRQMDPDQREALEMVAHKVGRILNGDPNYHDNWHDIIGYVKLVADRLEQGGNAKARPDPWMRARVASEPIEKRTQYRPEFLAKDAAVRTNLHNPVNAASEPIGEPRDGPVNFR